MEKVIVVVEPTLTGFSAYVPDLPITCTAGADWDDLKLHVLEAVDFHLDCLKTDNQPIPACFQHSYTFDYRMDIQDFFTLFKPVKQSAIAERSGINPSLLRQYARGIKHPSLAQAKKIEKAIHDLGRELLKIEFTTPTRKTRS